jgi:hypothetical protein
MPSYSQKIELTVIVMKSWTSTAYFFNSNDSSIISSRFSHFIDTYIIINSYALDGICMSILEHTEIYKFTMEC